MMHADAKQFLDILLSGNDLSNSTIHISDNNTAASSDATSSNTNHALPVIGSVGDFLRRRTADATFCPDEALINYLFENIESIDSWNIGKVRLIYPYDLTMTEPQLSTLRQKTGEGSHNAALLYPLNLCTSSTLGSNSEKITKQVITLLKKAAEQGLAEAQGSLGYCYQYGIGVKEDTSQAVKWYNDAVKQGLAEAQHNLGFCYRNGIGVREDLNKAVELITKAAEQGYELAQYNLSLFYLLGTGVKKDLNQVIKLITKAAEQGYVNAQVDLGHRYHLGVDVEKDLNQAMKWMTKAAEQKHPNAINQLFSLYCTARNQDCIIAIDALKAAAKFGHQEAKNLLEADGPWVCRAEFMASNISLCEFNMEAYHYLTSVRQILSYDIASKHLHALAKNHFPEMNAKFIEKIVEHAYFLTQDLFEAQAKNTKIETELNKLRTENTKITDELNRQAKEMESLKASIKVLQAERMDNSKDSEQCSGQARQLSILDWLKPKPEVSAKRCTNEGEQKQVSSNKVI